MARDQSVPWPSAMCELSLVVSGVGLLWWLSWWVMRAEA